MVALGALGIVTRLELDVEPTYAVSQQVRTGLTWDVLESRFDDITGARLQRQHLHPVRGRGRAAVAQGPGG